MPDTLQLSQMCPKSGSQCLMASGILPKCVGLPIELPHDIAYIPALLKLSQKGVNIAPSSRKLIF